MSPRDSATLSSIIASAMSEAASLWRNGRPGGQSDIAGATVGADDDPRRLVGEVLAHDELVRRAGRGASSGGGPVDPMRVVSGNVRARARDVRARAPARAVHRAESETDQATARDEREGERRADHPCRGSLRLVLEHRDRGRGERQALVGEVLHDRGHSPLAHLGELGRGEHDAMAEDGDEEPLHVGAGRRSRARRAAPSRGRRARAPGCRGPTRRRPSPTSRASRERAARSTRRSAGRRRRPRPPARASRSPPG